MEDTKQCRYCHEVKPVTSFHVALTTDDKVYRRRKCTDCYRETKRALRQKKKQSFKEFKQTLSCKGCGNNDFRVLQFHHTDDDKEASIANVVAYWSEEHLQQEIEKCIVLCANCHTIHHYEERNK